MTSLGITVQLTQLLLKREQRLHFNITDPLGTKRIQTSAAGVKELSCLSLPFGDGPDCDGPEATRHRFTNKERDQESKLDYFGARYYSYNMGRFMSPDWADKPEAVPYSDLMNPQSLNLYEYVNNNPLSKADSDGHCPNCVTALIGGVIGAGVNVGITYFTNQNATRADYEGAAASGFITGAVAGFTGGSSLAVQVGVNATANVAGGVVERSLSAGHLNVGSTTEITKDAAIGAAGPLLTALRENRQSN